MTYTIWNYVGIGLLLWAAWDIFNGVTYVWGAIYRKESPLLYWLVVAIWISLGVSCLTIF